MSLNASNPASGIVIFTLGSLAGAVFYLPFKRPIGGISRNLARLSSAIYFFSSNVEQYLNFPRLRRFDYKPKCGVQTRIVAQLRLSTDSFFRLFGKSFDRLNSSRYLEDGDHRTLTKCAGRRQKRQL